MYDKESGLYYYNARYYDPHLGSFTRPDPAKADLNHYTYCRGNSITYSDPTGLDSLDDYYDSLNIPTGETVESSGGGNNNTDDGDSGSSDYWDKVKEWEDKVNAWIRTNCSNKWADAYASGHRTFNYRGNIVNLQNKSSNDGLAKNASYNPDENRYIYLGEKKGFKETEEKYQIELEVIEYNLSHIITRGCYLLLEGFSIPDGIDRSESDKLMYYKIRVTFIAEVTEWSQSVYYNPALKETSYIWNSQISDETYSMVISSTRHIVNDYQLSSLKFGQIISPRSSNFYNREDAYNYLDSINSIIFP